MRLILTTTTTIILINLSFIVIGQSHNERIFLETNSKTELYYIELGDSFGKVYKMGRYYDKVGCGYSIRSTDTLIKQQKGFYLGDSNKVITESNRVYLITQYKKTKKFILDTITNIKILNTNLNNAYYLDHYFSMSYKLNKTYTLNHYSFRNGFYSWEKIPNKPLDHNQFKIYANKRLKEIEDSIISIQDHYVLLTNYLIQSIKTIDYKTLKDSLIKLPADFKGTSWYFGTVINEISNHRPDFFFKLAEDLPNNRDVIFSAVYDNKDVIQGLRAVENHAEIKKEFFKDRRFGKTLPYRIIGMYAVIIGIVTFIIINE